MGTHLKNFYHSGYLCTVRTVNINENNRTKILLISISFKTFKLYFIVSPFIKKWETIIFGVFSILWVKRIRIELLFCHFNSSWQLIVMKEFWRSSTAEQSNSNLRFTHLSSRNLLRVILCDCQSSATGTPPCSTPRLLAFIGKQRSIAFLGSGIWKFHTVVASWFRDCPVLCFQFQRTGSSRSPGP